MKTFYLSVQTRKAFATDENEQIVYARAFWDKAEADKDNALMRESDPTATNEVWTINEDSDLYEMYINDVE